MHAVHTLLVCALPWLSLAGQELVEEIVRFGGRIGHDADAFARLLGYRDRHQLARRLKDEGLPPLRDLAGWVRVLHWIHERERAGTSLGRMALTAGQDPAVWYKTVERVTGLVWSAAVEAGSAFLVLRFREHCAQPPSRRRRPHRSAREQPTAQAG